MSKQQAFHYSDISIQEHGLEDTWTMQVAEEVEEIISQSQSGGHVAHQDFTAHPFVTIDAKDARDFDDAVCASRQNNGWLLLVAIADVSHLVQPGTQLDKVARARATSVYFPDRVLPMLPEQLSNDLCSLRPIEDRLTLLCSANVDHSGEITAWRFCQARIRSRARLFYDQVASYLENTRSGDFSNWDDGICENLNVLAELAKARQGYRDRTGRIDFDLPEPVVELGPDGGVDSVMLRRRNAATQLVEECMLVANICAAGELSGHLEHALYRVHQPPSTDDVSQLRQVLGTVGLRLGGGENPSISDFGDTLREARVKLKQHHWVQGLLLRGLKQACYEPVLGVHFALSFESYTHFTSPIRRYPDLVVHRLLKKALRFSRTNDFSPSQAELLKIAEHCSMAERRADDAERAVVSRYKAQFMADKIGEPFSGVINGVTEFGVFVQLTDFPIDGLVHVTQLGNDYFRFNPRKMELVGERSGLTMRMGDPIEVVVAAVVPEEGKVNFHTLSSGRHQRQKGAKHRLRRTGVRR